MNRSIRQGRINRFVKEGVAVGSGRPSIGGVVTEYTNDVVEHLGLICGQRGTSDACRLEPPVEGA